MRDMVNMSHDAFSDVLPMGGEKAGQSAISRALFALCAIRPKRVIGLRRAGEKFAGSGHRRRGALA